MATLLDVGILEHFGSFFVVLLLFAIVFGVLESTKPLGDNKKGLYALVALFIAFLFMVSNAASGMVKVMVPWFIVVMVFLFFVLLLFRMFGIGNEVFVGAIKDPAVYPWVIVFSILVLIGSLGAVFGQSLLEAGGGGNAPVETLDANGVPINSGGGYVETTSTTTSSFSVNLMNTLRHPKVMGMVFVFLTGAFLMIFLTKPIHAN
jgi:hypothetical protein